MLIALFLAAATAWMLFFTVKYKPKLIWREGTSTLILYVFNRDQANEVHGIELSTKGIRYSDAERLWQVVTAMKMQRLLHPKPNTNTPPYMTNAIWRKTVDIPASYED